MMNLIKKKLAGALGLLVAATATHAQPAAPAPPSGNPVIRSAYTADPAALVHNGTVYLYTGHDEAPAPQERYVMHDWLCFTSTDMVNWVPQPVPLKVSDFA